MSEVKSWEANVEPQDTPAVRVELPDGCICTAAVGTPFDFFTCNHNRRWQISTGPMRSVCQVAVQEVLVGECVIEERDETAGVRVNPEERR